MESRHDAVRESRGGVARLSDRCTSAAESRLDFPTHPIGPPVQTVPGAVWRTGSLDTGPAYVGTVFSRGEISDFTALGDTVNVTAHLCSQAGIGEILVTESAAISAGLPVERLEGRQLSLKGYPMTARVLTAG